MKTEKKKLAADAAVLAIFILLVAYGKMDGISLSPTGYAVGEGNYLSLSNGEQVAQKVQDDPNFDTYFVKIELINELPFSLDAKLVGETRIRELQIRFYHDALTSLLVNVELTDRYTISNANPGPFEEVLLTIPAVNGKIPNFRLKIGEQTEIFDFFHATFFATYGGGSGVCTAKVVCDEDESGYTITNLGRGDGSDPITGSGSVCRNVRIDCNAQPRFPGGLSKSGQDLFEGLVGQGHSECCNLPAPDITSVEGDVEIFGQIDEGEALWTIKGARPGDSVSLEFPQANMLVQELELEIPVDGTPITGAATDLATGEVTHLTTVFPEFGVNIFRENMADRIFERYSERFFSEDPDFPIDPRAIVSITDSQAASTYLITTEDVPEGIHTKHNISIPGEFLRTWQIEPVEIFLIKLGDNDDVEIIHPDKPCVYIASDDSYECIFSDVGFSLFAAVGQSRPLLCNVCEVGEYSQCKDGKQTRLGNVCGEQTGYNCRPVVEERNCTTTVVQPPIADPQPFPIGIILVVIGVGLLLLVAVIKFRGRGEQIA